MEIVFLLQVLNSQYNLDQGYLMCVAETMEKVRPFGDIPQKISAGVKKSLVASRAILRAAISAFEVGSEMKMVGTVQVFAGETVYHNYMMNWIHRVINCEDLTFISHLTLNT